MTASFVEALMDHIMEGTMIPKVQIERVMAPILGMFLAEILTETLKDDPDLSGTLAMICPEFPFKKNENMQSENIDWLLINEHRKQLIFVELKTSGSSVNAKQGALYREKRQAVASRGGSFLIDDLKLLREASKEHHKYDHALKQRVLPAQDQIARCQDAKIVYLVPNALVAKAAAHGDRVLSFSLLAEAIPGAPLGIGATVQRSAAFQPTSTTPSSPVRP